jgi:predicted ATPase
MIESIEFHNFKVLRETTLRLGRFNLLVGPNGSGKSTVFTALTVAGRPDHISLHDVASVGASNVGVRVTICFSGPRPNVESTWRPGHRGELKGLGAHSGDPLSTWSARQALGAIRVYSFDADTIAAPVQIQPNAELTTAGGNLAAVLDQMRDLDAERLEQLNQEIGRLLPEYDQVLFDTPRSGQRSFMLRMRDGGDRIAARDLSHGTLLALAILTLAYLPEPPSVVCLEEPDRGIHPRLLQDVRDALYRLSYPENYGEQREPVQVIATTHSPYMLDLYREHPEEVIIAQKGPTGATFERLSERDDLAEILGEAHLGDVWYSGILGGVPATR